MAAAALIAPMTYEHAQVRITMRREYVLLSGRASVGGLIVRLMLLPGLLALYCVLAGRAFARWVTRPRG